MSHGQHLHEPRTSRRRIYPHGLVGPDENDEGEAAIETLMPSRTRPTTTHSNEEELLLESRSLLMTEFIEAAHRAAYANATILLTGDSGTGKSAFARQIHRWSRRREAPFLSVDCAAIPELLHDSDPFEDLRNTLAALQTDREGRRDVSDSATLLLDNLVDLPPAAQARLLQFVEERQSPDLPSSSLHVRIIAASSRDLGGEVNAGRFRGDLFYRINVLALRIPTLVERRWDIPLLAAHLLAHTAVRDVQNRLHLSAGAATAMANYHWPGNVRELRNAIERAAVLCTSDLIIEEHLPDVVLAARQGRTITEGRPPLTSLEEVERAHIMTVLNASSTMEEAAAALGINISTLWRKRKLYKIE